MNKVTIFCILGLATFLFALGPAGAASQEKGAKKCSDGIDNDSDGLVDEADPDCGGDDSAKPPETWQLSFEPRHGPTGYGLLTIHKTISGGFDYSGRNTDGCPSSSPLVDEWDIAFEKTTGPGEITYTADGADLIIDLLVSPSFDGCFGATLAGNGLFTLKLQPTGKGRNKSCRASVEWNYGHTSATEYLSMQSEGWIDLTAPFDQCSKTLEESSVLIEGNFNFFQTTDAAPTVQINGPVPMAFFVVFHSSGN